jgi:hypothetical protein
MVEGIKKHLRSVSVAGIIALASGCSSIGDKVTDITHRTGKFLYERSGGSIPVTESFGEVRNYTFENPSVRKAIDSAINDYARNIGKKSSDELTGEEREKAFRRYDRNSDMTLTVDEARMALKFERKKYRDNLVDQEDARNFSDDGSD